MTSSQLDKYGGLYCKCCSKKECDCDAVRCDRCQKCYKHCRCSRGVLFTYDAYVDEVKYYKEQLNILLETTRCVKDGAKGNKRLQSFRQWVAQSIREILETR